jgi:hypothetical protein
MKVGMRTIFQCFFHLPGVGAGSLSQPEKSITCVDHAMPQWYDTSNNPTSKYLNQIASVILPASQSTKEVFQIVLTSYGL